MSAVVSPPRRAPPFVGLAPYPRQATALGPEWRVNIYFQHPHSPLPATPGYSLTVLTHVRFAGNTPHTAHAAGNISKRTFFVLWELVILATPLTLALPPVPLLPAQSLTTK